MVSKNGLSDQFRTGKIIHELLREVLYKAVKQQPEKSPEKVLKDPGRNKELLLLTSPGLGSPTHVLSSEQRSRTAKVK